MRNWKVSIILLFDFLTDLFGDAKALKRAMEKTTFPIKFNDDLGVHDEHIAHLCGDLMLLADIENHNLVPSQKDKPPYSMNIDGKLYSYSVEMYDFRHERYTSYLVNESGQRLYSADGVNVKIVIMKAYDSYLKLPREFT